MIDPEYLEDRVRAYVSRREPTQAQKDGAQRSHHALRSALDTGNIGRRIIDSYLSGSYARHTAISPIDDVDIIFVIDRAEWPDPSPEKVLRTFEGAIRLRRPGSTVVMQRRSVGLQMEHLSIDAVPAVETGRPGYIEIPDRTTGGWILTAPKVHAAAATEVNKARAGLFIPLVKLLKTWNSNLPETARLKSFQIETMAVRIFSATRLPSLFEGMWLFFDFLCDRASKPTEVRWHDTFGIKFGSFWSYAKLPDVAETGSNLFANLSDERGAEFLKYAVWSRNNLLNAAKARYADTCEEHLGKVLR